MSQNPGTNVPEAALTVEAWLPGSNRTFPDGARHIKTAPCTIIAIVLRGSYVVSRSDGSRHTARAGEAFVAQEGDWLDIVHRADRRGGTMASCWVHLRITAFGSLDACRLLQLPAILPAEPAAIIREHIDATSQPLLGLRGAARRAAAGMATLEVLAGSARPSAEGRSLLARAAGLTALASWIRAHLAEPITLTDLARVAALSKSRLHARFQSEIGMAPMAWVRELRLQSARDRLLATEGSVAEIGSDCGFPDQFHFSRAIRTRFGVSPVGLRRQAHASEGRQSAT